MSLPSKVCLHQLKLLSHHQASGMSNGHDYSANHEDSSAKGENGEGELHTSKDLLKKLKRYGISGILSYGLLNTAYYLTTFLLVWALALAPIVDRGLSWFTVKFKFESQGKAFMAIVGFCFGLALILFFIVTLLWA
ncbi:uncharacterized protein LOC132252663 isoform X1 [Vitis vinifera]|uniref:uncharacterized protein LOC132252663 isoform X1 n=2 Tax=Vitis vinifera TaxID=29760 RepID=UPI002882FDCB|nr:uncharacterized protein LOC132252663 isoform X1 [Vitis vinifera]